MPSMDPRQRIGDPSSRLGSDAVWTKKVTRDAFGSGVYLSTSLRVATDFTRGVTCEFQSQQVNLRIVGVYEVVAEGVPKTLRGGDSAGGDNGAVPEKYVLVRDPSVLRLRYLLLYVAPIRSIAQKKGGGGELFGGSLGMWILFGFLVLLMFEHGSDMWRVL
eukprot:PhF_6_TR27309/c0_g1_i1/m.40099